MSLDEDTVRRIVVSLITLILSVTVHEFGHAWVADRLGDRLPRSQGRVTLNPMSHADPLGTIAFPIIFMLLGSSMMFGWGRPVQVSPLSFTRRLRMKHSHLLVAAAGPVMNLLFGMLITVILLICWKQQVSPPILNAVLGAAQLNFLLFFFNLLPTPPLDGGTVLAGVLPDRAMPVYHRLQQYGPLLLLAVIAIPQVRFLFQWPADQLLHLWGGVVLGMPV